MFRASSIRCYCAFCRSERYVYRKRHISFVDGVLSALAALLLSVIFWQDFDPRAVIFFSLGLGLAEIFIVLRWRLSIGCPHCGFDPVLYKRKPEAAAQRVNEHMALRRTDPLSIFTPPPKLTRLVKKSAGRGPRPPAASL